MNAATMQHQVLTVLLRRFMKTVREGERATLSNFIQYVKEHYSVGEKFEEFGHHRLRAVVSHALESGVYPDYFLSMGEGIVAKDYLKPLRQVDFQLSKSQRHNLRLK